MFPSEDTAAALSPSASVLAKTSATATASNAVEDGEQRGRVDIGRDGARVLTLRGPLRGTLRVGGPRVAIACGAPRPRAGLRRAAARGGAGARPWRRRLHGDGRHDVKDVEADVPADVIERERVWVGGHGAHDREQQHQPQRDGARDARVAPPPGPQPRARHVRRRRGGGDVEHDLAARDAEARRRALGVLAHRGREVDHEAAATPLDERVVVVRGEARRQEARIDGRVGATPTTDGEPSRRSRRENLRAQGALAIARLDQQDGRVEQLKLGLRGHRRLLSIEGHSLPRSGSVELPRARVVTRRANRYWISMPPIAQLSLVAVN